MSLRSVRDGGCAEIGPLGRSLQNVLPVAGRLARSAAWLSAHGDWAAAHENAFPAMAPEPVAQNGFLPPTLVTQPAVWTSTTAHRPGVQPPEILRNCSLSPRKSARRNPTKNSACVQFGRSRRDRKCLPKLGVGQRTSGWTKKGLTSIDFFKPFVTGDDVAGGERIDDGGLVLMEVFLDGGGGHGRLRSRGGW